jgi:hypothetical protein
MRLVLGGVGVRLAILASLLVLASASTAQALQRYAAPQGSGGECSRAVPCALAEAINKALTGDEVIITSGIYTATETMFAEGGNVDIHGDFAGPMPTIKAAISGTVINSNPKGQVSYLEIDTASEGAVGLFCPEESSVERVRVKAAGKNAAALLALSGCVVHDSLLLADGQKSTAIYGAAFEDGLTGTIRNVTAIATGPESDGIRAGYGPAPPGAYTIDVRNTIADGGAADLHATEGSGGSVSVIVGNSNFDRPKQDNGAKITDAGGNQAAAPLFVNAPAGDYREAAGSPTIDAGTASQLGSTDLAGGPRVLGGAVDIGAFEFVGEIQSLAIAPKAFRAAKVGEAIISAKKRKKPPVGGTVTYSLSGSAATYFFVERKTVGRRVKGKCVKATKVNRTKKKCPLFKQLKATFTRSGVTGQNKFKLSGRLGGRALKPGSYRLVGTTSTSSVRAGFKIVK